MLSYIATIIYSCWHICVTHMSEIRRGIHLEEKTNELVTPNGKYILITRHRQTVDKRCATLSFIRYHRLSVLTWVYQTMRLRNLGSWRMITTENTVEYRPLQQSPSNRVARIRSTRWTPTRSEDELVGARFFRLH